MKKGFLLLAWLWLCAITSLAQDTTRTTLTNDIGFNTMFLFDGILDAGSTPFSILYKNYIMDNQAIRVGFDANVNINDQTNASPSSSYNETKYIALSVSIGTEFQHHITRQWTWYYGADLAPHFSKHNIKIFQGGEFYSNSEYSVYGAELRPLLGLRFNIHRRIYISAEATVNIRYSRFDNKLTYREDLSVPNHDTGGNSYNVSVSPASGLFLFYRF